MFTPGTHHGWVITIPGLGIVVALIDDTAGGGSAAAPEARAGERPRDDERGRFVLRDGGMSLAREPRLRG